MAYPTDVLVTGELVTAAQINRWGVLLADTTLSAAAASIDLTSIPAHWTHLKLVAYLRGDTALTSISARVRFNGDSSAIYDTQNVTGNGATVGAGGAIGGTEISFSAGYTPAANAPANAFGMSVLEIANYAGTTNEKTLTAISTGKLAESAGNIYVVTVAGFWRSNAAINQITLTPSAGNFDVGSRVSLYGKGRI